jgi:hypothetical protein
MFVVWQFGTKPFDSDDNRYITSLNNTHQLDTLHNHFHFIKTQSLDMFQASLAHAQEALHKQFWWV